MEFADFILTPVYVAVIYVFAYRYRNKHYKNSPLKKYFIPGLTVKIIGAIAAGFIYFFYYGDGDTLYYFERAIKLKFILTTTPLTGLKILFADPHVYHADIYMHLALLRAWDVGSFMVVKITSLINILSFDTYLVTAVIFAFLSFTGMWKLLVTMDDIFPAIRKQLAIAILFIPSVFFWGSGLFKDTVTLGFIGWMTYACYMLFIKRANRLKYGTLLFVSGYIVTVVKTYVMLSFIPALILWIFLHYRSRIESKVFKALGTPFIILLGILLGLFFINQIGETFQRWSLEQIEKRAQDMQWWHTKVVDIYGEEGGGGSFYSLGDINFNLAGYLKVFPKAVNVTLFRPYLWEAGSVVMFLSAIESLVILLFTIRTVFRAGLGGFIKAIFQNPTIAFAFVFAMIFAFGVGFTSYNFGALVRYKIPCLPFYVMALFMIKHHVNSARKLDELEATEN